MDKQIFSASISNLDPIMAYFRQIIKNAGISGLDGKKFEVALEEAVVNIISYAYQHPQGMIEIEHCVLPDVKRLDIRLKDRGKPFNPCCKDEPEAPKDLASQEIGGLGIQFMRKLTDNLVYDYIDDANVLTLSKNIIAQES